MAKEALEFKINYTRMGEPFLNIENVMKAVSCLDHSYDSPCPLCVGVPGTHHYISTIGINGSDFSWIKDNITLQLSVHSFDEKQRDWLIPFPHKMSLKDMGQIRTKSKLKTTINMTMARQEDFDIDRLKEWFDPEFFFVKISPINENDISRENELGAGVIRQINLV
jgi:23S rRNA (adenine2503-C2)-methyltransferase